jgi:hypothetical protein
MAVTAALFAVLLCFVLLYTDPGGYAPRDLLIRGYVAILAVLSLITAEAIWRVRPWAYRAGRALAILTLAVFVLPTIVAVVTLQLLPALGMALATGVVALIVLPMVGYLRRTSSQP